MTQQVLANECKIFRTYLSRIETGTANPTITVMEAIAANLHVEIAALFLE
jgi:transcriptional regulator with XRE-family HTH domain